MLDYYFSLMAKFFKNKYKFINSIYILFLFFLIFFIKFSTIGALANSFKIVDLEISKPYDNNFNKEKVINVAFEKAFEELILRITTLKGEELNKLINLKNIYSLIESFSIVDEKFIDNKYISKFEVEFNKKQLFTYLERKNIFPSIPNEKDLLLIPILINNQNQLLLFSENIFYENWNKFNEKYYLLNYILPNEDIEDIRLIKKNINNIEEYDFNEIVTKYAINDYIILILFQKENNINALMKTNLNNKLIISNKKFNWNEEFSLENIIQDLKVEFENQWKKLNIINVSIKLPITLSVKSKDYKLIKNLDKKLYELDLVSSYHIDNFSNEEIVYKIIYNSTPDKFINEFTNSNIKLNTSNSIWRVE
jgi:Na+-transporting methylmalonyl-CoA/oxaloacetate decarboxylase gamma subunit